MGRPTEPRATKILTSQSVNPLVLERCTRLAAIGFKDLTRLAAAAEYQLAPLGNTIYRQGEAADGVYLVLDGGVAMERREPAGVVVERCTAPLYSTFGDGPLVGEIARRYTAVVDGATTLARLPLQPLQEVLRGYPDLAGDWTFDIMTRSARWAHKRRTGGLVRELIGALSAA